ncbi:hypothetical protein EFN10_05455, partial [Propionibacterium freudenreichii]|nr:hypothetical protein [Propionibacterium freudenreichii]
MAITAMAVAADVGTSTDLAAGTSAPAAATLRVPAVAATLRVPVTASVVGVDARASADAVRETPVA